MTLSRVPLENLPLGTVKIPLTLPRGAAWPIVAQIAALSQRASGCTASIAFLADQSGMSASSVYAALAAAGPWLVTRGRARWLAPLPPDAAWARISYRAAAAVGCRQVDGVWIARRNRSLLLQLYCFLRRDEDTGRLRSQAQLARELQLSISAIKNLLRTLTGDGWISYRQEGRRLRYITHDAPRLPDADKPGSGLLTGNDQGVSPEMIKAADRTQKHDVQARGEKQDGPPLAVGEVPHRKSATRDDALTRERLFHSPDADPPQPIRVRGALSAMTALPTEWLARMTERERERVLAAIETEILKGRTISQMTTRIRRRLLPWCGRWPRRAVAAALTVVRRGYECPRPDCEDHFLPSGRPCGACAEIGAEINLRRLPGASPTLLHPPITGDAPKATYARPPAEWERRLRRVDMPAVAPVDAGGPDGPAAKARALLMATSPAFAAAQRSKRRTPLVAAS
uniref:hypothetical protein n=1 Tax=Nonomuraea bangladeshensis TaxID=404385 RepID=UPI003F4944C7